MDDVNLKVFVGSIDFNATEKDVEEAFQPYGEIVHVILLRDKETQKSRGFGFVTFKEKHSVEAAIKGMHKQPILGRPIVVNYAEKKSANGNAAPPSNFNQQQQVQGFANGLQQPNPYYQGYQAQQGYAAWNPQSYGGWGQYWPQQSYGQWAQQWWNQQMQQPFSQQQQQGSNQNYSNTSFANNTNNSGGGSGY